MKIASEGFQIADEAQKGVRYVRNATQIRYLVAN
jgi:hypothetical protein